MTCAYRMVDALRTRLGLPDPAREDAPTDGIWAEHWRRAGGVPPDPELAEMEERRGRARAGFAGATVSVLPVIRGHEGDRESAELLTKLLQDAGLCRALSAGPEIVIDSVPGANEQALLWDLARGFREHVRRHGIDTDYALLAQYFLDPETRRAHAVHFVVCDRGGDWVIVDLQNAHHDDFRSVAPTTADACGRLVVERMRHYLTEE
jgi:hypothetical protein